MTWNDKQNTAHLVQQHTNFITGDGNGAFKPGCESLMGAALGGKGNSRLSPRTEELAMQDATQLSMLSFDHCLLTI